MRAEAASSSAEGLHLSFGVVREIRCSTGRRDLIWTREKVRKVIIFLYWFITTNTLYPLTMKNCSPSRGARQPAHRILHNKCVLFFPSPLHRHTLYLTIPDRPLPISFSLNAILYNTAKFPPRTLFLRNCSASAATYLPRGMLVSKFTFP